MPKTSRVEVLKAQGIPNNVQLDLFVPLFDDLPAHDIQDTMLYPFVSLSRRARKKPIEFDNGRVKIRVEGLESVGIASIYDFQLIQWAVSQIREAQDRGEETSPEIWFYPFDILKAMGRGTGKQDYLNLEKNMRRLKTTNIDTTIRKEHIENSATFSWLDGYTVSKERKDGEPHGMYSITVNKWVYMAAVNHKNILTMDDGYWTLKGNLERWLYRFGRKVAGGRDYGASYEMKTLHKMSGDSGAFKYFARDVRDLIKEKNGLILDYHLGIFKDAAGKEKVLFTNRRKVGCPKKYKLTN